jgi:hypothetical protein
LNHVILLLVAAWRKEDGIASCYQPEAAILSPPTTSRGRVKLVLLMRFGGVLFVCKLRNRSPLLLYRFGVRLLVFFSSVCNQPTQEYACLVFCGSQVAVNNIT